MKTVRLPDGGFPFSSLGASPDLSLACIQFGPFYECAVFAQIIVHRMGYFKRTRASDEQLATDPHGQTQTISDTGCLRQHTDFHGSEIFSMIHMHNVRIA